jgi:2-dehydropantoate 2-reductase
MRVAVMGSGGLGGFLGGLLARAGEDVTLIARGMNLQALRAKGLTVRLLPEGEFHCAVRATDDPRDVGPVDLVWFCVKTFDLVTAARQAAPLIGPGTLILPIQNGVEATEELAALFGDDRVLGCVSLAGATLVAPGIVAQKLPRVLVKIGERSGGSTPRTESLRDSLLRAGIETELSEDIQLEAWEKFVIVSVTLGLAALTRLPLGPLFACAATAALARGLMQEVASVARAKGIRLSADAAERLFVWLRGLAAANPAARGSMYFDLAEGRRLELEAINGAVIRMGREVDLPTPLNFAVYAALKPYADGALATAPVDIIR